MDVSRRNKFSSYLERVHFTHEVGHPSMTICRVAVRKHAEMIIVGRHRKGFIDRALIGSVAYVVLHRASIPVLIVNKLLGFNIKDNACDCICYME